MAASDVSAIPGVRAFLLGLQQEMAKKQSLIMDGRDIGTVVIPDAELKIFLTASNESRAKRRHLEYIQKGQEGDIRGNFAGHSPPRPAGFQPGSGPLRRPTTLC